MNKDLREKILFLKKVVMRELKHLLYSDKKIFDNVITIEKIKTLTTDEVFAEQVEAFGSRFGRLQDTLGQKLLPAWLKVLGEQPTSFIDNLNKAEKLGILPSVEEWMRLRELRNQMVHEYIDDDKIFFNALKLAHASVPLIKKVMNALVHDLEKRGYVS